MTAEQKQAMLERWRDLYLKIHATAADVRAQTENDWELCATVLGVAAPSLPESRELIAKMVEERAR